MVPDSSMVLQFGALKANQLFPEEMSWQLHPQLQPLKVGLACASQRGFSIVEPHISQDVEL
jgi:hypothetical protein